MVDHSEDIDRYFAGKMGAEEIQQFEEDVRQNPILEQEFLFEQELVEAIQAMRRAELKAMLNKVHIDNFPSKQQKLIQILISIATTGMMIIATYLYFKEEMVRSVMPQLELNEISKATAKEVLSTVENAKKILPIKKLDIETVQKSSTFSK